MASKLWIAASVFAVLIVVGVVVWWSRNFWLVDALLLRSTVAAGLLAALATGGVQLLQLQRFSSRTLFIISTLFALVLGLAVWAGL